MSKRELEYLATVNLAVYTTLLRRLGVKSPTVYAVLPTTL